VRPEELTPQQQAELLLGFGDHARFCRESLRLLDRGGSRIPLECWPSQLKLTKAIERQRKQGRPVRILVLKTRRSGFTVGSCSHIFHETPFFPGRKAFIIADKYRPAALEAFDYLEQFRDSYRPFGGRIKLPEQKLGGGPETMEWGNGSMVEVFSADRGEIRGGGRHWALFDEIAFWRSAAVTFRSAVNMVPDLPDSGVIAQSTANGVGGEFYERCQKAMDPATAEGWEFVFFGWLEDLNNSLDTSRYDPVALQRTLDKEEHTLHEMHSATLGQLAWRRWKIRTAFNGHVDAFHQEYPTTPDEAFLTSGRPALTLSTLVRMPVWQEPLVGELQEVEEYPKPKLKFVPRDFGALVIGKKPDPARAYVIGADPSKGIDVSDDGRGTDPDWSVAGVLDLETGEQVAQLRERIRPVPFAEYIALLGKLYNWAFIVPEANDAGFIDALLRTNYPLERIYTRRRDPTDRRSAQPQDIGFETTGTTRPWLISALDDAMRETAIIIRSPIAQQECRTFVIKPNGKMEHQTGCHDDCVMMLALACIGIRHAPRKMHRQAVAQSRAYGTYGIKRRSAQDDD
jgi:hypothetical protein